MQEISFTSTISEKGIWVLDLAELPLPDSFPAQTFPYIVHFGPGAWGGNHVHERQEAFLGIGDGLVLIWRDEADKRHEAPMASKDGVHLLFVVPAWLPHMVENRSKTESGILYEIRDMPVGDLRALEGNESLQKR